MLSQYYSICFQIIAMGGESVIAWDIATAKKATHHLTA